MTDLGIGGVKDVCCLLRVEKLETRPETIDEPTTNGLYENWKITTPWNLVGNDAISLLIAFQDVDKDIVLFSR